MFMSTVFPQFDCDGAIMITASHLPYNRNGMKFFTKKVDWIKPISLPSSPLQTAKLLNLAEVPCRRLTWIGVYSDFLVHTIRKGAKI